MASLVKFFLITFAVTWAFYFASIALSSSSPAIPGVLVFAGTIAPAFVALALTPAADRMTLIERTLQWRVGLRWYAFALGFIIVVRLAVAVASRYLTGEWPRLAEQPSLLIVAVAILFSTPFQAGEEIGWRGFALPRLAERYGFGMGSIILGLIWAGWHLPLFYLAIPGNEEYGRSFPAWAIGVTALSVTFGWLYVRTGRSLLLTMLMHSVVNNIPHFEARGIAVRATVTSFNAWPTAWLMDICLWIAAGYFLIRLRRIRVV